MRLHHWLVLLLFIGTTSAHASSQVIQFLVHANEKSDITRLFPGAYVDFTWNNVFIVSIWTSEPESLTRSIKETLEENTNLVQILVPPYTLEVSTQKWLQYNLVFVVMLVLIFVAGCVCGGGMVMQCFNAHKAIYRRADMFES